MGKRDIEVVEEKEAEEEMVKEEVQRTKAQEQAKDESLLERAAKEAAEGLKKEKEEDELILRINDYLEEGLAEGKISKNLYNHLKEGLIESVVDGMRADVSSLTNSDFLTTNHQLRPPQIASGRTSLQYLDLKFETQ